MNSEEQEKKLLAAIEANESVQKYFAQFTPSSVKNFIDTFFLKKQQWMQYGKNYQEEMETDGVKWVYKAFEHLQFIQQKKLFDTQCLWRAEKLTIKEVELCCDFIVWEKNILNCPFIEPVSMDDIEMYIMYLQQENKDELDWFESWQDYDSIKDAYNTDGQNNNFPDWYDFYNGKKGTGVLMVLPNIRGEKEAVYKRLAREQNKIANIAKAEEFERTRDKRLWLNPYDNMEWFVNTFENEESRELYKAHEWKWRNSDKQDALQKDLDLLFSAEEKVSIAANTNWIDAIQKAAETYRTKKIIEAMPDAWEQYMINIQTGIAFTADSDYQWLKDMEIKLILEGRALNGESADLNF